MSRNPLDLPVPLIVDTLLPLLPNRDLVNLRAVSKHAKYLVEDEVLWKRKVLSDFTFPAHATARMGGWYNLYTGLSNPNVYVWGQTDNGRLGLDLGALETGVQADARRIGGIPYPIKLDTIGAGRTGTMHGGRLGTGAEGEDKVGAVVEIVAGGWSFHARTSTGRVWSWGTMDGEFPAGPYSPIRDPGKRVSIPQLMDALPSIKSLSGGRCHAVALTQEGRILEWRAWGSILELEGLPSSITKPPPQSDGALRTNIKQLEAGWSFSTILTHTGEIWLWYSDWSADAFRRTYYRGNSRAAMMHADPPGNEHLSIFPINVTPIQLPLLSTEAHADESKIVQIAAGEDFIIALTSAGTLHRIDLHMVAPTTAEDHQIVQRVLADREDSDDRERGALIHQALMTRFVATRASWEHLAAFSDPEMLPGFDPAWLYADGADGKSSVGKVTHISAHFRKFVAFLPTIPPQETREEGKRGETLVLLGSNASRDPELIPELQSRGVIKVTMGDYHYGALTETGEMLTWGSFSKGALGNWTPPFHSDPPSTSPYDPGNAEQGQGDEGERGWLDNLVQLPRVFRPRVGFAGRGGRGTSTFPAAGRVVRHGSSGENVKTPTVIKVHKPKQGASGGTPFAFDIAFAGWHSSALVMDAPSTAAEH